MGLRVVGRVYFEDQLAECESELEWLESLDVLDVFEVAKREMLLSLRERLRGMLDGCGEEGQVDEGTKQDSN